MIEYRENGDVAYYEGLSFRRDKRTGYYLNAKTHKRLHVYVWESHNGRVPEGYHVHHIDFDKSNNEIENLQLLTAEEHISLHGKNWTQERYEKQVEILRDRAVPKAAEWHKTESGKEWHKQHYEQTKQAMRKMVEHECEVCGKRFVSTPFAKFCSNGCKSAHRRKTGVDDEIRRCVVCGGEYKANRYSKSKTCSRECRSRIRQYTIRAKEGACACV